MKMFETLRAFVYLGIGFALFYAMGSDFFWDHVPAPVSENIGKIFAGLLMLLMISPLIFVLVDAVITKERPSFLARVLKKSKWYEILGVLLCANFFLLAVLALYFEGGAYPWGEIIGSNYYVISNMGEFEVSADWFWVSYWHGLSAWAGAGLYGVGAFLHQVISNVKRDDQRQAVRSAYGLLFVLVWLTFVAWDAARIAS